MEEKQNGAAVPLRDQLERMAHADLLDFAEAQVALASSHFDKNEVLKDRINSLSEANDQHKADLQTTRQLLAAEKQRAREAIDENNNLRSLIHGQELAIARLEGYRDRVVEFDPVSEKRQYDDGRRQPGQVMAYEDKSPRYFDHQWYRRG